MISFCTRTIRGSGRGKRLGFPTINLNMEEASDISRMKHGVYACGVKIFEQSYKGALFFGTREMFGEPEESLEVHLLDVNDIEIKPDTPVEIQFGKFIRPPCVFKTEEELKRAMQADIQAVRKGQTRLRY